MEKDSLFAAGRLTAGAAWQVTKSYGLDCAKVLAFVIDGTIFAILVAVVVGMATAHAHSPFGPGGAFVFAEAAALVVALTAPTSSKAWRRLFVMGLCTLALPLGALC